MTNRAHRRKYAATVYEWEQNGLKVELVTARLVKFPEKAVTEYLFLPRRERFNKRRLFAQAVQQWDDIIKSGVPEPWLRPNWLEWNIKGVGKDGAFRVLPGVPNLLRTNPLRGSWSTAAPREFWNTEKLKVKFNL